jgi:hypothetical protein
VRLEFTSTGVCVLETHGADTSGKLTYRRRTTEWRCAIAGVREGEPVRLEIVLPRGMPPARQSSPRFDWTVVDGRATGVADLPSPPDFVTLESSAGSGAPVETGGGTDRRLALLALGALGVATLLALLKRRRRAAPPPR